jgi:hypothetical protein
MQDWPLRLTRLFDHAAREHGPREIVSYQDGMHHPTHADRAEPRDQVTDMVGGERGDPVARFDSQPPQRFSEPARVANHLAPARSSGGVREQYRDYRLPAV